MSTSMAAWCVVQVTYSAKARTAPALLCWKLAAQQQQRGQAAAGACTAFFSPQQQQPPTSWLTALMNCWCISAFQIICFSPQQQQPPTSWLTALMNCWCISAFQITRGFFPPPPASLLDSFRFLWPAEPFLDGGGGASCCC